VDSVTNAFSPRVARTSWRFFPRRLLHRRQPLQEHWLPVGQEGSKTEKLDSPKYQIGPFDFPEGNSSLWSAAQAVGAQSHILCRWIKGQSRSNRAEERDFG
jgi:hypothetical protein